MAVTAIKVKEINYYLKERKKTVAELTSESWDPLCVINLKIAFRKGYDAKHFYNKKKK
ncbi:hypothetical protein ES705_09366 [subsurface metagenome]